MEWIPWRVCKLRFIQSEFSLPVELEQLPIEQQRIQSCLQELGSIYARVLINQSVMPAPTTASV